MYKFAITWGTLVVQMNTVVMTIFTLVQPSFLTDHTGFVCFAVLNHVCWENLILLKDDKHRRVQGRIHTAVTLRRRARGHPVSFDEKAREDSGYKHNGVSGISRAIFVRIHGIFRKVTSWKQSEKDKGQVRMTTENSEIKSFFQKKDSCKRGLVVSEMTSSTSSGDGVD